MIGLPRMRGLLAVAGLLFAAAMPAGAQGPAPAKPLQFVYVLRLAPAWHQASAWTEKENAIVGRHFARLKSAADTGQVILAGRTGEPLDRTFGLVVFEAESEESARRFMETDPAVEAGLMTATLHPYVVALRSRQ